MIDTLKIFADVQDDGQTETEIKVPDWVSCESGLWLDTQSFIIGYLIIIHQTSATNR